MPTFASRIHPRFAMTPFTLLHTAQKHVTNAVNQYKFIFDIYLKKDNFFLLNYIFVGK